MGNKIKGSLEKIYTPDELIRHMFNLLQEHHTEPITEFLEPCAGSGHIIDMLRSEFNIPIIAFDIFNETSRPDIHQVNFLTYPIAYKPGRVTIMNPPFTNATKFIKKCAEISDFVITVSSINSFINIDYEKLDVKKIDIFKKYKFCDDNKYDICVIAYKLKERSNGLF